MLGIRKLIYSEVQSVLLPFPTGDGLITSFVPTILTNRYTTVPK